MQDASDGLNNAVIAPSRTPKVKSLFCWDRTQQSCDWFRLDQSKLDEGHILTLYPYAEGVVPNEIISQADSFYYEEETDNIISAEGSVEIFGDNYQSSLSETDIVLDNTSRRYIPHTEPYASEMDALLGHALKLAGNGNVSIPFVDLSTALSYDIWFKLEANTAEMYLLSFMRTLIVVDTTQIQWYADTWNAPIVHSVALEQNRFYHLVITQTGTSYKIYLDSSNVKEGTTSAISNLDDSNKIGALGASNKFTGQVDELKIYNRVLTPTEVVTSYNSGLGKYGMNTETGLIICYHFDQRGGTVIQDYAENNDGTLTNGEFVEGIVKKPSYIGDLILPRRPNKLSISISDANGSGEVPVFTGITETIEPNLKLDTVHIHSYDFGNELQNIQARRPDSVDAGLYINTRTDDIIRALAGMGGMVADNYILDVGKNIIPFFWVQDGSVWYYMNLVAESEGGRVFFDENGVLNFWNRDHIDQNSDSKFTFTMERDILEYSYRIDKDEIKNHIIVKTSPREVKDEKPIYTMEVATEIPQDRSEDFWAELDNPVYSAIMPTNIGLTCFYKANTSSDGTGTDVSSLVDISNWYVFGKDIKFTLTNNYAGTVYITKIVIIGRPVEKIGNDIVVEKKDQASIDLYGDQLLQIENDYIQSENYATNLATDMLFNLKDPRDNILMHVVGVPYLQVGDIVTVPEGFDDKTRTLFIKKKRWQISPEGDYIEYIDLLKKTIANFFVLDESIMDETDVLSA